ncbi:thiamine pyrophosphate-binding protein [Rhodomicrobium vannielii ATCC 17100]|uniref:thiamine pyrophosphate-dependent enzyme n=1 Tax=Rhodomicrobium vannielii TaxID=1069 RepID=UPI00191B755A|nr:thiamine pyrophosphate-binding protein [Rhodomicrobium vannielii ATCC 17100]
MSETSRSGGQILADQLRLHGARMIFGVPGESYLAVLDALYDHERDMPYIVCRQEGGAAMMAEAYGKLTGEPGICMVTRGPGATNASAGLHVARQDSTPMILIVGQVGRSMRDREAFQEIDFRRMFGEVSKWVAEIEEAARIPEYVARAFTTATSGRPGPVVLAVPEDVLRERATVADAVPYSRVEAAPARAQMAEFRKRLAAAERPLMIVGGGGWDKDVALKVKAFAEHSGLPVAASFRRQSYFDNTSPCYVGDLGISLNPALKRRIDESDLIIAVGPRLGEMPSQGYSLFDIPKPKQPFIHIHAGAEELGRVYQADLAINAGPHAFADALEDMKPLDGSAWAAWRESARADYEAWIEPEKTPGALQLAEVVAYLRETLPGNAIIANGAGNFAAWVHRFYTYRECGTGLAPISGSMGYGVPAGVAAKLVHPGRTVVTFAGDGDFLMSGQEFATAVQHGAPVIFIVVNNGMYGTIRMHQERHYPGRVSGTSLRNPDFAAYARAFGGHGAVVERTEDFPAAFEEARASGLPSILELRIDPEAINPKQSLSEIRAAALGNS